MRIMKAVITVIVLLGFAAINLDLAFSQYDDEMLKKMAADEELQQEFKWLKAETYVITASRVMEEIKKSAASITVVTDRQIRQMGARDLTDLLSRAVPSLGFTTIEGSRYILVRGAWGTASSTVLLMINSHPVNRLFSGGFSYVYDDLIIDNIKRIEVIRGPGSALYGANAFHGVINVITKEAGDIDGFELTARGGSWDTQQYNLLYGKNFSGLEVSFDFNFIKTHGFRGPIEEDYQTYIDGLYGPSYSVSLAPGRMAGDREKYDVTLNLKYKGFRFDGKYVDKKSDLPVSHTYALTNKSFYDFKSYYLTLSYETSIWEVLDLYSRVYRNENQLKGEHQQLPPGFIGNTPTGPKLWQDGLFEMGGNKSNRTGIEVQTTYKIAESNTVVAGATYEQQKAYEFSRYRNYLPTPNPGVSIWYPSVQELPDEYVMDTEKRNFKAIYIEDIWDLTDDIRLTTGGRYDHYSDFGGEVSPRVGLTWEYMKDYDLKLLYGHAFRAPSFIEYYFPWGGNTDLDPEKIDTYEISLGAEFTSSLNGRVTFYHRETENDIVMILAPITWVNRGSSRDQGVELEMKYDFGRGTYIAGNYNYSSWKTERGGAPRHLGKFMANIRLSRYLNFNADCRFLDGMSRTPGDTRDDPSGYAIVNTTLIAKKFLKGYEKLELRVSVYNLLDKDWKTPTPQELPHDLPMPGINYLLEMKYTF